MGIPSTHTVLTLGLGLISVSACG